MKRRQGKPLHGGDRPGRPASTGPDLVTKYSERFSASINVEARSAVPHHSGMAISPSPIQIYSAARLRIAHSAQGHVRHSLLILCRSGRRANMCCLFFVRVLPPSPAKGSCPDPYFCDPVGLLAVTSRRKGRLSNIGPPALTLASGVPEHRRTVSPYPTVIRNSGSFGNSEIEFS